MALITCPECGKQVSDKATACPNCGCPISAAQPSAVEITAPVVEPASSVSAPKSNDFEKYMTLARRAKEDSNAENAARYYDLALRENPLSWEASFYQVYFTVEQCKIIQIESAARAVANCQSSVLTLIRDHVPQEEQGGAVAEVVTRTVLICRMLSNGAQSHYNGIDASIRSQHGQECLDRQCAARDAMYACGDQVAAVFDSKESIIRLGVEAWKAGVNLHNELLPQFANAAVNRLTIQLYLTKIAAYDSSFAKKEKKKILTQEINEQKAIINRTPTEGQFKLKGLFWFGLFWLSMLFFIPVLAGASVEFFMREMSFFAWAVIIIPALLCMVFGIIKGVPKQEDIEKNRAIVAEAQKKLKEKEDALQKLG